MNRRVKALMLTFFLTFNITSCTYDDNNKSKQEETQIEEEKVVELPEPTKGGEIIISFRMPKTLNPILNEDYTVDQVLKLVFDTLIDFDESQKPTANLASNWSFSSDGSSVTINLRQDVRWHDGNPFTARDVVFSLDTIKSASSTSPYKKCIDNIVSYKAEDDYTVKIFYNQPFSGAIYALYFPIIPAHIYEGVRGQDMAEKVPVGTGAYKLGDYKLAKELQLEANPDWFKGEPYIERIKVLVIPDDETEFYSFEQGQIDLIGTNAVDWGKYAQNGGTRIKEYVTSYYDFIGFNFNKTLFQDKKLRKAIAYALDKESILENQYLNHGVLTDVPVNPSSWLYCDEIEKYNYDIEKSKELLSESGWADSDQDGILDKSINGNKVDLSFNLLVESGDKTRKEAANEIINMLGELGIKVNLEEVTKEDFLVRLQEKNFDAFLGGWKLSPIPDFSFAFHSSQIENGSNFISFKSEQMDNLLANAFTAVGEENMKTAYDELQKYISDELPYISLYFRNAALITNDKIQGELKPQKDFYIGNIKDWFIYEPETDEQSDQ
ncbi:MAG: peptide ABC transporter substrate-binding protein [Epulopiscium sp.]|nr:peptide ABC transporter substrate-binding protein [Candidatus Epulonipiscium sp.]